MRLASIDAISKLFTDEENVEALGSFVERFRHRMLEAAADVDVGVCSAALSLLSLLLQHDLVNLQQLAPVIKCDPHAFLFSKQSTWNAVHLEWLMVVVQTIFSSSQRDTFV